MAGSKEPKAYSQYGYVFFEIMHKDEDFRNEYARYVFNKTRKTLRQKDKIEIMDKALKLYLSLEGLIIRYVYDYGREDISPLSEEHKRFLKKHKKIAPHIEQLKKDLMLVTEYLDRYQNEYIMMTTKQLFFFKKTITLFLIITGVKDIFFENKKGVPPELAITDFGEE